MSYESLLASYVFRLFHLVYRLQSCPDLCNQIDVVTKNISVSLGGGGEVAACIRE